jgi:uncharacterized protein
VGSARISTGASISQYVVKVHSRCDLACSHCYVYEHADQSWRSKPTMMSVETVRTTAERIAEHAGRRRLDSVTVILHGGEPLLLGAEGLRLVATELRRIIEPVTTLDLRMQSNGVLLSERICDVLVDLDIVIGISLDGDGVANDRHRLFRNGASSHDQVLRALALLRRPQYRRQYAGILCTVDVRNDPLAVYQALAAQLPPRVDLLLPHATWDSPPMRPVGSATPYADWLLAVFQEWDRQRRPMPIRLFEALLSTGAGGPSGSEWVGLDGADLLVVETDGTWEQVDSLKTAYDGAAYTGLTVVDHSVDEAAAVPAIAGRLTGLADLAPTCQGCPVVQQCGGGLFAHRYRRGTGFANPSVYCDDLLELVTTMNQMTLSGPPARADAIAERSPVARPNQVVGMSRADDSGRPDHAGAAGLPDGLVESIGGLQPDPAAIRFLLSRQAAIIRTLVAAVGQRGSPVARAGLDLLGELERRDRAAVTAVLSHPYLRRWAVQALAGARQGRPEATGQLGAVAAAAAFTMGSAATVPVWVDDGVVHLPSVGTLRLSSPVTGVAELTVAEHRVGLRLDGARWEASTAVAGLDAAGGAGVIRGNAAWLPSRWISVDGLEVLVEDLDPYRHCHDWKVAERLSAEEFLVWRSAVSSAWRAVERDVPARAAPMRLGLRAVTPLSGDPGGLQRASTARHAFGAVGTALTGEDSLSVTLVHEFQHSILGALLDICKLCDTNDQTRVTVAWRTDPRPVEGALHGTFAHVAVAEIWRVRALRAGAGSTQERTFHQYRDWTVQAIEELDRTGALTGAGATLLASIHDAVLSWSDAGRD